MRIFKNILDFYIESSLHVAFAVYALIQVTFFSLNIYYDVTVAYFGFFGTVVGYNFVKYFTVAFKNDALIRSKIKEIVFLSCIALAACLYFFLQLRRNTQIVALIFFGLTLLYTLPFSSRQKNVRNWKGIKIYIVSITWVGVTLLLPIVENNIPFSTDVLVMVLQRFLLIFTMVLVFDVIDLKHDDHSLQTIPQQIGVKTTKKLGYVLLFLLLLFEFFYTNNHHFLPLFFKLLVCGTIAIFTFFANENRSRYYASFWLESVPILWWLVLVVFR